MDGEEMADSGGCVGVGSDSGCGGDMGESAAACSADGMDSKQANTFLQTAIINKDVMLSGVSTHSPVSSSHALSSVTLPASILTMAPAVSTAVATGLSRIVKSESTLAVAAGLPNAIKDNNYVVNVQPMCDLTDFNRQDQAAASALVGTQLLNQQLQHQLLNQSQQAQLQLLSQSQQGQQSTQLTAQQQTFIGQQNAAAQLLLAGGQGGLLSQAGLLNQAGLLGQNSLLANQVAGLFGQGGLLSSNLASQNNAAMSIQHLLIPVSTANGGQQLVSIPLSLAAGLGNQIQLLATSGGQLIATSMAGSTTGAMGGAGNQLNLSLANAGNSVQPLVMVGSPLSLLLPQTNVNAAAAAAAAQTLALRQLSQQQQLVQAQLTQQITQQQQQQQLAQQITAHLAQQQQLSLSASTAAAAAAAPTVVAATSSSIGSHPQIITNSQGQIFVIASPQLLQQALSATSQTMSVSTTTSTRPTAVALPSLTLNSLPSVIHNALSSQHQRLPNLSISSPLVMRPGNGIINLTSPGLVSPGLSLGGGGASNDHSGGDTPSLNSNNGLTPNINQLLPSSVNSPREGTIVDGVNLDEMREFAKQFKIRRLSLGLTQTQVGQALSVTEGPSYSQSAICRFEKLDITPKSAQKIKPVLERWMGLAEERYKNGMQNLSEFIGIEPSKKRKRRTSFTPQALELLNEHFIHSTHPSGSEMTELADKLNFDREVIRVWFCNKRQTLKNTIKQLKGPSPPPPL